MIRLIRAEFLKLLTTRSTYVLLALCTIMLIFFAFYIEGFRKTADVTDAGLLASSAANAVQAVSLLIALRSLLLVTHEYAHNTIMYTLTASRSRFKVFLAKAFAVTCFAVLVTVFFGALSPLLTTLGLQLKGLDMAAQNIPYLDLLWRGAFYGWAYSMLAMIMAFIIRNQVGSIITLIFVSGTVEMLLSLLLKENSKYLPFTALANVLGIGGAGPTGAPGMPPGNAALVVVAYVIIVGAIAVYLFKRRDAN